VQNKCFKDQPMSKVIIEIILALCAIIVIIPLYMIVINSFKSSGEAAFFKLNFPSKWIFKNYRVVFDQGKILKGFFNSIIIAVISLVIINISASAAAFCIQRNNRRLTNSIYYLFVLGLVMPVAIVPTIKTLMIFQLHNTYQGMVLYYSAVLLPFTIFLMTGYIKSIPKELDESAIIDGSNYFILFFRIILPILQPVVITASLVIIINIWNDFLGPFYLLSDISKWTVTISVFNYIGKYGTNWGLVFADITAVITPIIILYFLLQEYIIEGMTAGAVKG
jgi:raffinose/stachyose/melibiose transport system permease protein